MIMKRCSVYRIKWYSVQRSDWTEAFVHYLQKWYSCLHLDLLNNTHLWKYDLIFANAVFLHFTKTDLSLVLEWLKNNLTNRWFLACSFKKWVGNEYSDQKMHSPRFFQYWNENDLSVFFELHWLQVLLLTTTSDEKWIHLVVQ